ncbi:probable AMP deaminase, partial [Tanacetum coccineum]
RFVGELTKQVLSDLDASKYQVAEYRLSIYGRTQSKWDQLAIVEDTPEYEDGGEIVVREMVPYEFDSVLLRYLRQAIQESLKRAKDVVHTAKNIEIQKLCLPHLIHNPK